MKNNRFLSREGKRSEMEDKIGGQKRASLTVWGGTIHRRLKNRDREDDE